MISINHRKQIDLNLRLHEVLNLNHLHPGMAIECEQGVLCFLQVKSSPFY